jgi:hypothetical protein
MVYMYSVDALVVTVLIKMNIFLTQIFWLLVFWGGSFCAACMQLQIKPETVMFPIFIYTPEN